MKNRIFAAAALAAIFSASGALAYPNGTPNAAAGAQGRNAPSSAEPTPAIAAGLPHAEVQRFRDAEVGRAYHGPHNPQLNRAVR